MGFNTSMIILNDALNCIKNDVDFGKNVYEAIRKLQINDKKLVDIASLNHANAASVINTQHADATSLIAFGGNYATVLDVCYYVGSHHEHEAQVNILKSLADKLGYKVVKKRKLKD